MRETAERGARPSRSSELSGWTAGWRRRPNPVSGLESSAAEARSQCIAQGFFIKSVPWRLPGGIGRCGSTASRRLTGFLVASNPAAAGASRNAEPNWLNHYRVQRNALIHGARFGRRSPAACTITSTAKFFVRIHKIPRKSPASDVMTMEYPTAISNEGCAPRASCVAAVRR